MPIINNGVNHGYFKEIIYFTVLKSINIIFILKKLFKINIKIENIKTF